MDRKSILKRFEAELRESHQNYLEGKGIPLEEFDWGLPPHIAESKTEYRIQNEAWTPIEFDPRISLQISSIYSYIVIKVMFLFRPFRGRL